MKLLLFFVRRVLSLRYKVIVTGMDKLKHDGPVLIMPNHIALVDPRIIVSFLGKYLKVSPLASEKYYNKPGFKQIMDLIGTVPIGEMSMGASQDDVKKAFGNITKALSEGKNILVYPSGEIYRQGFESIKGKQSAYYIVNNMPENTKIIGVRDRGLWGSIWSMAWDNGKTTFLKAYIKSIGYVFSNLIFFVPKRKVSLDLFDLTEELKEYSKKDLNEFNKYLEDFYNDGGEEKLNYQKHYFYFNDVKDRKEPELITGSIKELSLTNNYDLSDIDIKIKNDIKNKISEIKEINEKDISNESKLVLELFFDSLDLAEVKSYVQANFEGASNPPINDLKTVGDLYVMAAGKSMNVEELKECNWGEVNNDIVNISEKLKVL